MSEQGRASRGGRPPRTSVAELEVLALELFSQKGFDETTLEDLARAAGIGRRTFFRYYPSKNDLVWGDFDARLVTFRAELAARERLEMMVALRDAVVEFNRIGPDVIPSHRRRMRLILEVPALQAHSTLRYAAWRQVVAEFAAARTGHPVESLLPRHLGHAALATSIAAYEQWLMDEDSDLDTLLHAAFTELAAGFAGSRRD